MTLHFLKCFFDATFLEIRPASGLRGYGLKLQVNHADHDRFSPLGTQERSTGPEVAARDLMG